MDPRTPVVAGVGAATRREGDPVESLALMVESVRRAGEDAGAPRLAARAGAVLVPKGIWGYADPGRLVADAFGATGARTVLAEIGVLQTTLLGRAAAAVAAGEADVVLVVGAEARASARRAEAAGEPVVETPCTTVPTETWRPAEEIVDPLELERGLAVPVVQYALMEVARRHADGQGVDEHRREVAALWSAFSRVAVSNPHAWTREAVPASDLVEPGAGGRWLAVPYTARHASQWNVDQGAAVLVCSTDAARSAGVAVDRWVFPHAVAESNHMVPLVRRRDLHRSVGFAAALAAATAAHDGPWRRELYSCFPIAVRTQALEGGIPLDPAPTLTGGMRFAGGPLNSFVLQAMAPMVGALREAEDAAGLVTAVSGMLTKQGASVWSCAPPARATVLSDVSESSVRSTVTCETDPHPEGPGVVVAATVVPGPAGDVVHAICDTADGRRTIARSPDADVATSVRTQEWGGRRVRLRPDPDPFVGLRLDPG